MPTKRNWLGNQQNYDKSNGEYESGPKGAINADADGDGVAHEVSRKKGLNKDQIGRLGKSLEYPEHYRVKNATYNEADDMFDVDIEDTRNGLPFSHHVKSHPDTKSILNGDEESPNYKKGRETIRGFFEENKSKWKDDKDKQKFLSELETTRDEYKHALTSVDGNEEENLLGMINEINGILRKEELEKRTKEEDDNYSIERMKHFNNPDIWGNDKAKEYVKAGNISQERLNSIFDKTPKGKDPVDFAIETISDEVGYALGGEIVDVCGEAYDNYVNQNQQKGKGDNKVTGKQWGEFLDNVKQQGYEVDSADASKPNNFIKLTKDGKTFEAEVNSYSDGTFELVTDNINETKGESNDDQLKRQYAERLVGSHKRLNPERDIEAIMQRPLDEVENAWKQHVNGQQDDDILVTNLVSAKSRETENPAENIKYGKGDNKYGKEVDDTHERLGLNKKEEPLNELDYPEHEKAIDDYLSTRMENYGLDEVGSEDYNFTKQGLNRMYGDFHKEMLKRDPNATIEDTIALVDDYMQDTGTSWDDLDKDSNKSDTIDEMDEYFDNDRYHQKLLKEKGEDGYREYLEDFGYNEEEINDRLNRVGLDSKKEEPNELANNNSTEDNLKNKIFKEATNAQSSKYQNDKTRINYDNKDEWLEETFGDKYYFDGGDLVDAETGEDVGVRVDFDNKYGPLKQDILVKIGEYENSKKSEDKRLGDIKSEEDNPSEELTGSKKDAYAAAADEYEKGLARYIKHSGMSEQEAKEDFEATYGTKEEFQENIYNSFVENNGEDAEWDGYSDAEVADNIAELAGYEGDFDDEEDSEIQKEPDFIKDLDKRSAENTKYEEASEFAMGDATKEMRYASVKALKDAVEQYGENAQSKLESKAEDAYYEQFNDFLRKRGIDPSADPDEYEDELVEFEEKHGDVDSFIESVNDVYDYYQDIKDED